jgi:peroxiredoxin (alkyl hydroperoxide reductase subunit C)
MVSVQPSNPEGAPQVLTVGDQFPEFDLMACTSLEKGEEFQRIDAEWLKLNREKKGWLVVFAWPKTSG